MKKIKLGSKAWGKEKTEPKVEPVKNEEPEVKVKKKATKKEKKHE